MSLSKPSDGILETPVTWEEFESNIRTALNTEARLGPNKSVFDIGEGIGFASRCCLIAYDWVGAAADEKLPSRVVLKIPSALPFRRLNESLPPGQRMFDGDDAMWEMMEGNLRKTHNVEVATYDFFGQFEGVSMPKKYYGKPFGEEDKIGGQLCIEYMENSRMMNFNDKYSIELVKQIARAIGKLNAFSLLKEPIAPELQKNLMDEFAETVDMEGFKGMFKGLVTLDDSEKTKDLLEKLDAMLPDYLGSTFMGALHKKMGVRPVLVNGDLRTENILIDKDSGDLAALIDWQCTHPGIGLEDLHRIAMFSLTTEERHTHFPMLIEEMYKSLVENLNGAEPPYSLDTLILLSDILFPHCALFFGGPSIALIANQDKDPRLSNEEKAKRKEVMMEKLMGALEDAIVYDVKNKTHTGNLDFRKK
ncbi:hypothetical protein PMAYCL1PPCAC_22473 [Pristionchus mayeri]|uniref:CHK kinase-like domain-containing protein n=1 Tax=Pristionchus mayeri TaxID=1317129 RepID=A0AAN5CWK3_9BILA|nr:hypothetical protein PMAYCL1PPCAC_22473 [Pristionchus mayeri]